MGVFRLRSSISLSVVVHAFFVIAWMTLFGQQATQNPPKRLTWIEVDPLPAGPLKNKKFRSRRMVQTEQAQKTDQAAPDAFLGERTQITERETVSRNHSTQIGRKKSTAKASPVEKTPSKSTPKILPNVAALSKYGVALPVPSPKRQEITPNDDSAIPSGAGAQDYVKGFKESEKTVLNTKEYVFFGYFQRIRHRLDLAWDRTLKNQLMKIYYRGRQLASDMEHTTRILVTLSGGGEIVRVQVVEESGTRDLDDAAIRAFNEAGPFPNPPKGIVDAKGKIEIRWDFILRT